MTFVMSKCIWVDDLTLFAGMISKGTAALVKGGSIRRDRLTDSVNYALHSGKPRNIIAMLLY